MNKMWGPHSIERFATYFNTKLPIFTSRFWNPGCENIDAFTVDWSKEYNWLVPPPHLIPRLIFHMMHTNASGTLICSQWYSAPFWPILFPDGQTPIAGVAEIQEIPHFPRNEQFVSQECYTCNQIAVLTRFHM